MSEKKRSPLISVLIKGIIFMGFGVIIAVQPWLRGIAWVGWVILAAAALIMGVMGLRIFNARKMQRNVVARFDSGDAVFEKGLQIGGTLYDFSTFGAVVTAASYDGDAKLAIEYSYYAQSRGRARDQVVLMVSAAQQDKINAVLNHLDVPDIQSETLPDVAP